MPRGVLVLPCSSLSLHIYSNVVFSKTRAYVRDSSQVQYKMSKYSSFGWKTSSCQLDIIEPGIFIPRIQRQFPTEPTCITNTSRPHVQTSYKSQHDVKLISCRLISFLIHLNMGFAALLFRTFTSVRARNRRAATDLQALPVSSAFSTSPLSVMSSSVRPSTMRPRWGISLMRRPQQLKLMRKNPL